MADLGKIVGKLGSLIRLLASDRPGEVVATAAAIKRVLASAGTDVHALAEYIEKGKGPAKLSEADMRELYDAGQQAGYKQGFEAGLKASKDQAGESGFHNIDGSPAWDEIAKFCHKQRQRLPEREREFVDDMLGWTRKRKPTEKQERWLRSIYNRLGGRLAA